MKKIIIGLLSLIVLIGIIAFALLPKAFEAKYQGPTITTRDGTKLVTIVHLPEGEGPFPTLIVRSPYDLPHVPLSGMTPIDYTGISDEALPTVGWPEITAAGYALVIQHSRGRIGSEGRAMSFTDREDGLDLIHWIQKQAWSNGQVGTMGDSAGSILSSLMNAQNPTGLIASFDQVGSSNLINEVIFGAGGALKLDMMLPWIAENATASDSKHFESMGYGPIAHRMERIRMLWKVREIISDLDKPHNLAAWKHLPLLDYPVFSEVIPEWNDLLKANATSTTADYFDANTSKVPTYHVATWYDLFCPSQLASFEQGEKDSLTQRLLILNGTHYSTDEVGTWPIQPLLPWFNSIFKGEHSALLDLPRVIFPIANGHDEWYGTTTWPLPFTKPTNWYLSKTSQQLSTDTTAVESGQLSYQYNPAHPVPTIGGRNLAISHGPLDQQTIRQTQRKDVLSYDSEPLDSAIVIAGKVKGNLTISSDCPDTDFTIKLLDLSPDGSATLVTEGILRVRYREGLDKEVFMQAGELYQIAIDVGPIAWRFETGHQIGIDISSSNFPQWDRNLNTDTPLYTSTEQRIATNTIHHGLENGSFIELPIIRDLEALAPLPNFKTNQN